MTIANWSTTAASNNAASPNGILGSRDLPSALPAVVRQNMADTRSWYNDAQWTDLGDTPTYGSATTLTIGSDVTTTYTAGRKIKLYGSSFGTHTGVILSCTFSSPNSTITVKMDEGTALTSNISQVFLAVLSATYPAISSWVSAPKNIIMGGNFNQNPWQRGVTFTGVAAGSDRYTADRWVYKSVGTSIVSISQASDGPLIGASGIVPRYVLSVDTTTADTSIGSTEYNYIGTRIEGTDFQQIAQYPFTLGFWVKSVKTGIFCVAFVNSNSDRSYVAEYTINTTNTWEYKTITVPATPSAGTWDYTYGLGLGIYFTLACGSNFQGTASTWTSSSLLATSNQVNGMDSISNQFRLSFVSLIRGTGTFDWSQNLISQDITQYQRYFWKTYPVATALATVTDNGSVCGIATGGAPLYINFVAPVDLRYSSPTLTLYAPKTGTSGSFSNRVTSADVAATIQITSQRSIIYASNSSGLGEGTACIAHLAADMEL